MAQPSLEVARERRGEPAWSAIICAYNSRHRIDAALTSLCAQDVDHAFEVIAVVSGDDGTAEYLTSHHPGVRVVRSKRRLHPGAARNAGIDASRGAYIAFLPDDGLADRKWLRLRAAKHDQGYPLVSGAISNATPRSLVGTAGYYVEYAASMPVDGLLEQQMIPHTLSYDRSVFARVGRFPEVDHPGEDTLLNAQCIRAGLAVAYEHRAHIGHINLTSWCAFLSHQARHGRGLVRCVATHGIEAPYRVGGGLWGTAYSALVRYPSWRWRATLRLVGHAGAGHIARFLLLTPIIVAGYLAGGLGAFRELRLASRAGLGAQLLR